MQTPTFNDLVAEASVLGDLLIGRGEKIAVFAFPLPGIQVFSQRPQADLSISHSGKC